MTDIRNECSFLSGDAINNIEDFYNAKYLLESCLMDQNGNWANFPAAIFYTEKKHPQGSNYFALYYNGNGELRITNALSSIDGIVFSGIRSEHGVIYSRFRHDYRSDSSGSFVDGGRDYFRYGFGNNAISEIVTFKVEQDKLVFC